MLLANPISCPDFFFKIVLDDLSSFEEDNVFACIKSLFEATGVKFVSFTCSFAMTSLALRCHCIALVELLEKV